MLLDLRLLLEVAGGSTGAPVVVTSRPSGDEMYAYRKQMLAAVADEEAALALYVSDHIDIETLMRILKRQA